MLARSSLVDGLRSEEPAQATQFDRPAIHVLAFRRQLLARSFDLPAWPSCYGARRSAASESAVVPSATPGSETANAWPARPRQAAARHILGPAPLRAFDRVPSDAGVRAEQVATCPVTNRAAVLLIETDSISVIGPIADSMLARSSLVDGLRSEEPAQATQFDRPTTHVLAFRWMSLAEIKGLPARKKAIKAHAKPQRNSRKEIRSNCLIDSD